MTEVLQTLGLGILTYLAYRLVDLSINRFKSERVRLKIAPAKFLEYLQPGSSIAKAKEILGEPMYETDSVMIFKMKDLNIQIEKKDNIIETITAVLPKFKWLRRFKIHPLKHELGSVKVRDVLKHAKEINYDKSAKHGSAWIECYFGNPGYYNYYTFGIFNGPSASFPYEFPELHVSIDDLGKKTLKQKFNYVSISNKSGCSSSFDFHAMR